MKRLVAVLTAVMMLVSGFASYAVSSSEIASELQDVYSYLEQAEKDFISSVRTDLQNLPQSEWDSALNALMGPELPPDVTQVEIEDFILGLTQVYFNADSSAIADDIDQFKTDQAATVDKLFGSSATINDLLELLYSTKANITSTLDGGEKLQLTTASGDSALISDMEDVLYDAVVDEINASYPELKNTLSSVGWDIQTLLEVQNDLLLSPSVTYGTQALVAAANATVRSEAALGSGDTTPTVGDTITYTMSFFGQETNLFKLSSTSSLVTADSHQVTAEAAGTATIYVHRLSASTEPTDYDYIYKFDITISEDTSSGDDGGSVAPPPMILPEADVEDTTEAIDEIQDDLGDVSSEEDAVAVMEEAETVATQLTDLAEDAETEEEIEAIVTNVVEVTEAVSTVAEQVESPEGALDALTTQTVILESVTTVLAVVDEADVQEVVDSAQALLETSDEMIDLMDDPDAAEALAVELIQGAAPLLEAIEDTIELSQSLGEIAESFVALASSEPVPEGSVVMDAAQTAVATLDAEQILSVLEASNDAVDLMAQTLAGAQADPTHELTVSVTLEIPEVEGAAGYASVLPAPEALAGQVDVLAVSSPVASIQVSAAVLEEHPGEALTVSAAVVDCGDLSEEEAGCLADNTTVYAFEVIASGQPVTHLSEPLMIRIPLEVNGYTDLEALTIIQLLADGTTVPMGGHYEDGFLVYRAPHTSNYFIEEARKHFTDVPGTYWASDYIELLAGKGIISGRNEEIFDPTAPITRAEFTALLMRAMAYCGDTDAQSFSDVAGTEWYAGAAAAAYQNGIVGGKGGNQFAPYDTITREEMAKMIANVLVKEHYVLSKRLPVEFNDYTTISLWAVREVETAVREGIISGLPDGTFMPKLNASRAVAATMVYQLFIK